MRGFGFASGRHWALFLPLAMGVLSALTAVLARHGLSDSPIVFVVVTTTAAIALGSLLRRCAIQDGA